MVSRPGVATIVLIVCLGLVSLPEAYAGPNCEKNPSHPSCSGDGGGGSGGGDPPSCSSTAAFPAFVYFGPFPNSGNGSLWVAAADGSCAQQLASVGDRFNATHPAFSYEESSGTGRVVWIDGRAGSADDIDQVMFLEFSVTGTSVAGVTPPVSLTETPDTGTVNDSIFGVDLSPDGSRAAIAYDEERGTSVGSDNRWSVRLLDVASCRQASCPAGGLIEVAAEDNAIIEPNISWRELSWSPQGNRLYVRQGGGAGTKLLILDEATLGPWMSKVLFDDATASLYAGFEHPSAGIYVDASGATREGLAFYASQDGGESWCQYNIFVIDVANCENSGNCGAFNAQVLGQGPSWGRDGRLYFDEHHQPPFAKKGRQLVCGSTGNVAVVDPLSSGPVIQTLVSGNKPDGG